MPLVSLCSQPPALTPRTRHFLNVFTGLITAGSLSWALWLLSCDADGVGLTAFLQTACYHYSSARAVGESSGFSYLCSPFLSFSWVCGSRTEPKYVDGELLIVICCLLSAVMYLVFGGAGVQIVWAGHIIGLQGKHIAIADVFSREGPGEKAC